MFKIITLEDSEKWDSLVKSFKLFDVYYLSGYTIPFHVHGDGEPILIYYENKNIRGINVVMKRDITEDSKINDLISNQTMYDITTPYGYGGFLIEGDLTDNELEKFNAEYTAFCTSKNIITEFVRFNPLLQNSKNIEKIYEVVDLGKTISIDLISKEQIWNDFSSKNRNVIRKAIKQGVEIFWGMTPELIEEFIPLYNNTMKKDNASDYYYFKKNVYEAIIRNLKFNTLIFYAVYNKKIISMAFIIFGGNYMHYHLSASDKDYQHLAPSNLLLYEAAVWGVENGFKFFHLGGGVGSAEDGLFKFKKAFNKKSNNQFSIGKKVFNSEKYEMIISDIANKQGYNIDSNFFPAYRKKI